MKTGEVSGRVGPLVLALVLVFTLASALAIHPYRYGLGDNRITIPLTKAFENPALYPGDPLIAQRPFYYTYLWTTLGLIHSRLGASLPALFLGTYLIALYFTFLGLYRIAMSLFGNHAGAMLSLVFMAFSGMTPAGIPMIDTVVTTRAVAMPILLFAIAAFLDRRTLQSFVLLGLAYLAHPMTTHYVLGMLIVASAVARRGDGLRPLATGILAFLVLASPILIWKFQHSPPSLHLFTADARWIEALRYRSPHHMFPFTWGWGALLHGIVGAALLGLTARHCDRPAGDRGAVVASAAWTVLGLCAAGIVFSELLPMGLAFISMPIRSFVFLEMFTMIYVAHGLTAPGALRLGMRGLIAVLTAVWVSYWIEEPLRVAVGVLVVLALLAIARFGRHEGRSAKRVAAATAGLISVAGCACALGDTFAGVPGFSIDITAKPLWQDVQRWARHSTDIRSGFIIPPLEPVEFRVGSERTVYVDSEGGGLMNFNPDYGIEWLRRMRMLGELAPGVAGDAYCALGERELIAVASEMAMPGRRVFVVWPCAEHALGFPVRYRNTHYAVYEVPSEAFLAR